MATNPRLTIVCPLVFLGCNWQGTFESSAEAKAAEAEHWSKKHEEANDGPAQSAE